MTNAAFKLEDSGFTRDQVDALTEFMTSSVATKEDITHLEGKIIALEGKINAQGERLEGKMIGLDGKINLVYWMLGVLITVNVGIAIKLLFA